LTAPRARRGFAPVQLSLAAAMAVGIAGPARAQLSVTASLDSDYRLRGYSLTQKRPALSANLGYDAASGLYLGASGVAADTAGSGVKALGYIAYGGYARRFGSGRSLDIGLSRTRLNAYEHATHSPLRYTEVYAGASTAHFSLRAQYSPHYIRDGAKALYVDLGAGAQPAEHWRVSAHAGLLRYLDRPRAWPDRTTRYDLRAVVARVFDHGDLHLTWTFHGPDGGTPSGGSAPARHEHSNSLGLGATYVF
jgi:uncharacterized protein (TIGR02001 family)